MEALAAHLALELPGFALCYKDESRLQRLIGALLRPFNRSYLSAYTTVMFGRLYFPSRRWCALSEPFELYALLRHEAVHLRDAHRWPVLFELSYLFCLPAGLTLRAFWEWRGYTETFRVWAEIRGEIPDWLIDDTLKRFTGPEYLYMWPFPGHLRRRLEALRGRLLSEIA